MAISGFCHFKLFTMEEVFKTIIGFEKYKISNFGNVISLHKKSNGNKLKPINDLGYLYVNLCNKGKRKKTAIHRLVGIYFLENTENKPEINHIDGNKSNNYFLNLEWCTSSENQIHAYSNNLQRKGNNKLTKEDKIFILNNKNFGSSFLSKKFNVDSSTIRNVIKNNHNE